MRASIFTALAYLAFGVSQGRAQEPEALAQVVALEKVIQKAVARAEPSIACILVSRSDYYRKLTKGAEPRPGQLGGFQPQMITNWRDLDLSDTELKNLIKRLDLADPGTSPESFGSGVVIDTGGFILTNYHVVKDATKVYVRLPGGKGSYANIHAGDPRSDLAVLKIIDEDLGPLTALPLGDGATLQRGQFVLALANPYAAGFRDGQPSVSWGLVSNVRRRSAGLARELDGNRPLHHFGTLVQVDVRLQLGCSGGALLNLRGELIGLTTALAAIQGGEMPGGFALPLNMGYRRIIEVLLRGEEVDYGFLGVSPMEVGKHAGPGVLIDRPTAGSPADLQAKLHDHDRILSIDGVPVNDLDDLFRELGLHLAGSKVRLEVRRQQGFKENLEVTLVKFAVPGPRIFSSLGKRPYFRGMRVDYTSVNVQTLQYVPRGVVVSEVKADTSAAAANLRTGEIITHVNGQAVRQPADFYALAAAAKGPIELTIQGPAQVTPAKVVLK